MSDSKTYAPIIHLGDAGTGAISCGAKVRLYLREKNWTWVPEKVTCKRCLARYKKRKQMTDSKTAKKIEPCINHTKCHGGPCQIDQPAAPVVEQRELSILYPWITKLSLRYQGVLLAAIRGCDGRPKNDISKSLNRAMRNICLVPFDPRELAYEGFMSYDMAKWREDMTLFEASKDEYPVHYVMHMVNAISVVAYEHPDPFISGEFMWAYQLLAKGFHFHTESREELKGRMERDRIADRKSKEHQATKATGQCCL